MTDPRPAAQRLRAAGVAALGTLPLGSRVVVRYRVAAAATDALGVLLRRSDSECEIHTRRGNVTVQWGDIVAAKQVPPPPPAARGHRALPGS